MKKRKLSILIVLVLFLFPNVYGQKPITWDNYGTINSPNSNDVLKTDPDGFTTGGATSTISIPDGCDGYFEFTLNDWNAVYIGVSTVSSSGDGTAIERSIYISGTTYYSHVGGSPTHPVLTFNYPVVSGNKIRVDKVGNNITFYYVDAAGALLFIHQTTLAGALFGEVQRFHNGSSVLNGMMKTCEADWFLEATTAPSFDINDNIYTFGNVGIGINTPTIDLDVNGEVKIRQLNQELSALKVLVADNDGLVKYSAPEDLNEFDADWLKPNNDPSDDINDDIYTNGKVGIGISNPDANLDIVATCNNKPSFRIHRGASACAYPNTFGNLLQIDAEDGFPTPVTVPYMVMNSTGRLGIGTDPGNDSRAKICSAQFGSAFAVYKDPDAAIDITAELRVGTKEQSSNMVALSVNDGDCNGTGAAKIELMGDGTGISYGGAGWVMMSDKRLKHSIEPIADAMGKLNQLRGVSYEFNQSNEDISLPEGTQTGVIAQEVEKVIPDAVYNHPKGYKAVNYDKIIPLLIEAVKSQDLEMQGYDEEIDQLENDIKDLYSMVGLVCQNRCEELGLEGNTTGDETKGAIDPDGIELYQNLPNPFNNNTIIPYYIPEGSEIQQATLIVTSISGKIVKEFPITETGHQQVVFDRNELSRGYYTYTLMVNGERVKTLKAIIK